MHYIIQQIPYQLVPTVHVVDDVSKKTYIPKCQTNFR